MLYGVEAASARIIGSTPGGGYTANAVHFEGWKGTGPTYLDCSSLTATDNSYYSFSLWQKGMLDTANNGNGILFISDPTGVGYPEAIQTGSGGYFAVYFSDGANTFQASWYSLDYTSWDHWLFSSDMNRAAHSKLALLYVNGTLVAPDSVDDNDSAFSHSVNGLRFTFNDDTTNFGNTMDIADVWIAPGVALHDGTNTIPSGTRGQFISGGNPVDPAGWPTSAVQFYGDAAAFVTNRGTGGSFSLTGSLTNAGTHP